MTNIYFCMFALSLSFFFLNIVSEELRVDGEYNTLWLYKKGL